MPDTKRSLSSLQTLLADNTAGDISAQDVRDFLVSVYPIVLPQPQGRLTTESGVAVSTSDRTSQSTIYYTPYTGNGLWLYDGTIWQPYTFTERSLALTGLTSGKNYDVFIYDNAGTVTLELSAAWTTDTARADALTTQDGVYVKSGATTRRWVGTIRATGTTTTEMSFGGTTSRVGGKLFVWNYYNQVKVSLAVHDAATAWAYTSATIRQANAQTGNKVEYVCGENREITAQIFSSAITYSGSTRGCRVGVGVDSTTTMSGAVAQGFNASTTSAVISVISAQYRGFPGIGYHAINWLEQGQDGNCSFYGTESPHQSRLVLEVWA